MNKALNHLIVVLIVGSAVAVVAQEPQPDHPEAMPDIVSLPAAIDGEFGRQATWRAPAIADVRTQVMQWLEVRNSGAEVRAQVEALWAVDESSPSAGAELLERVARTFVLVDPAAKELVEFCSQPRQDVILPAFDYLANDKLEPFVRNNLRLLYGRWLAQQRYFEESLQQLSGLEPAEVVDPAGLLFYQAVNQHWFLQRDEGLKTIARLFERREELPRRYATAAMLMQADLSMLKDESLDHISRRMNDITRRLDFGHAGKKVQGVENGVIASLDKMIEELEQQQQQAAGAGDGQGGDGPPQGIQSRNPAKESRPAVGKGPGNVDKKRIGSQSGWGDLPAKEREEALQQIGKDFPSHYRDIIESYFRKIAESE